MTCGAGLEAVLKSLLTALNWGELLTPSREGRPLDKQEGWASCMEFNEQVADSAPGMGQLSIDSTELC